MERLHASQTQPHIPPSSLSPSPTLTPSSLSPPRSRRQSDSGMETAAKTVVLFPGSGTIAAATLGALGSVAAVATGGVALLGAGAAVAAFKFSPSLNKESCQMSREEKVRELEVFRKAAEERRLSMEASQSSMQEDTLATVLAARDNHRY